MGLHVHQELKAMLKGFLLLLLLCSCGAARHGGAQRDHGNNIPNSKPINDTIYVPITR